MPVAKASDLCILLVEVARCFHLRGAALFLEDHPITEDRSGGNGIRLRYGHAQRYMFCLPSATKPIAPPIASSDRADGYAYCCFDFASGLQVPPSKAAAIARNIAPCARRPAYSVELPENEPARCRR